MVAVAKEDKRVKADQLSTQWMGSNLSKKGLEDMLRELGVTRRKAEAVSPEKAQQNWKRLASFMSREMR